MLVLQSVQTDRLVSSQIPTQGVSEYEGDDPIRLSPDGHTDINICIVPQYPTLCGGMFDDDVHMSAAVHNPGAGCPIRRPSDLSAPHICSRSPGFHCTAALYNSFRLFPYELLDNGGEKAVQWS